MEKIEWENGLRILLLPEEDALSASVDIWVEAGSLYEDPARQGISHFAEHMLFKGTQTRTARRFPRRSTRSADPSMLIRLGCTPVITRRCSPQIPIRPNPAMYSISCSTCYSIPASIRPISSSNGA